MTTNERSVAEDTRKRSNTGAAPDGRDLRKSRRTPKFVTAEPGNARFRWPLSALASPWSSPPDLDRYLTFEALRDHRTALRTLSRRMARSRLAFMAVYALAVALSLPGGAVLTIAGGFCSGPCLAAPM